LLPLSPPFGAGRQKKIMVNKYAVDTEEDNEEEDKL